MEVMELRPKKKEINPPQFLNMELVGQFNFVSFDCTIQLSLLAQIANESTRPREFVKMFSQLILI